MTNEELDAKHGPIVIKPIFGGPTTTLKPKKRRTRRIRCDQCDVLAINGIGCHEHGCPNSHLDPSTQRPWKK